MRTAREYLEEGAWKALFWGFAIWVGVALLAKDTALGGAVGGVVAMTVLGRHIAAPSARLSAKAGAIERDLPFVLLAMSVELNTGIPFNKSLHNAAMARYGEASRELLRVEDEVVLRSASVSDALRGMSERVESRMVRRAVVQLVNAYEQGNTRNAGEALRRIALEMLSFQRSEQKAFSSKMAVFSLLFVAVSAIVPALFESFVLVGSLFLEMDFSAVQVLLIMVVGFPLLDVGVLLFLRGQMPLFLREGNGRSQGVGRWVEGVIAHGGGLTAEEWARGRAVEGTVIGALCAVGALYAHAPIFYITCGLVGGFLLPAILRFCFLVWHAENRRREMEERVADVLLQSSAFPAGTPTLQVIAYCAKPEFGVLGAEFAIAQRQIQRGASLEVALSDLSLRCDSRVVDWSVRLLLLAYSTGTDLSDAFRTAAEDLLETGAILRERSAALLVEKYTVLFAGGLLVPAVLGLLSAMVSQLDWSAFATLDLGTTAQQRLDLRDAAMTGIQLYLVEYAVVAGLFVGNQEGNIRRGLLYAAVLMPVGLIAFWIAKGG
jgi:flagellar protein FlaJ